MLGDCFPIKCFIAIDTVEKCLTFAERTEQSETWSGWEVFFKPKWYSEGFIKQWSKHVNLVPQESFTGSSGINIHNSAFTLGISIVFPMSFQSKGCWCRKTLSKTEDKKFLLYYWTSKIYAKKKWFLFLLSLENISECLCPNSFPLSEKSTKYSKSYEMK